MTRKRKVVGIVLFSVVGILVLSGWLIAGHIERLNAARELAMEGKPTTQQLLSRLDHSDTIVLNNTLTRLERSKSDLGRERAAELLRHPDLYVWYGASMYLGAIGDQRSVPYLIRGLDHPAWRSRPRVVSYLKNLTREDFGEDKGAWVRWWNSQHSGESFDFESKKP